ncbi:hypothetical protein [Falsiroseomonas tokyonensis]|uniref:Uncharacterized protein n=1 Tax=Falsiroseomonas tokyonensis TaxID=430521 RepID=A0ABV7BZY8_9PROT|nr:hypothetical protein [Falsiroseomonas tokyonensis]MBU8540197.1 hypothetical protein [Falsiroseomonas tokyonensis]
MAGSIGNRHILQPEEWRAIRDGDNGPWCLCAVDQARMHPGGGPLEVIVVALDASRIDITDKVIAQASAEGSR